MATQVYHIDWIRHFDVPFTQHKHVEFGQQTIEHKDREPGESLNTWEVEAYRKTGGDHPGFFFNCNDDYKRWFLNAYDKRHRNEIG
jgi:hypothetical protein